MTQQEKLAKLIEGQIPEALRPHLLPMLDELEDEILSNLRGGFRAGTFDPTNAIAGLAKLCLIEDLRLSINKKVGKLNRLREELANGSEDRET